MRIYIVGSISSGKSTLAKNLSKILSIPYQPLDEVVRDLALKNVFIVHDMRCLNVCCNGQKITILERIN